MQETAQNKDGTAQSDVTKKEIFSTRDLHMAATLVTLKFYMVGIDYQIEGQKNLAVGYFMFEDTPELRDAMQKYVQGLVLIEPREYQENVRMLKAQVENMKLNPHNSIFNKK